MRSVAENYKRFKSDRATREAELKGQFYRKVFVPALNLFIQGSIGVYGSKMVTNDVNLLTQSNYSDAIQELYEFYYNQFDDQELSQFYDELGTEPAIELDF